MRLYLRPDKDLNRKALWLQIDNIQTEIQEEKFLAIVRNQQEREQGREAAVLMEPGTDPMLVDEG